MANNHQFLFCLFISITMHGMEDGYIPKTDIVDDLIAIEKINDALKRVRQQIAELVIKSDLTDKEEEKFERLIVKRDRLVNRLIRDD